MECRSIQRNGGIPSGSKNTCSTGLRKRIPLRKQEGWLRHKTKDSHGEISGTDTGDKADRIPLIPNPFRRLTTPSAPTLVAFGIILFDGAATPPLQGGEKATKKGRLGNLSTRPFSVFVACRLSTMRELDLHKIGLFV